MSSIGPQLPPELTKRKRTPDQDSHTPSPPLKQARHDAPPTNNDEINLSDSDSNSDIGPSAPPTTTIGPFIPASTKNTNEINLDDSDFDAGPALPQPQPQSQDSDSEDSEDEFGPSLPSSKTARPTIGPTLPSADPTPQRDTWMLAPPPSTAYSERDPTRMRARKFASKAKPDTSNSTIWTETPEEKLQRQKDALLGRSAAPTESSTKDKLQEERDRRIAHSIEATRGKSLYNEHSQRRKDSGRVVEDDEDDPSKRAFDREKDMAIGGKIGGKARSELISKSANFGGRFQKGSFL